MNNYTTSVQSTLLLQKLSRLAVQLQQSVSPNGNANYPTLESVVSQAFEVLSQYYKALSQPQFNPIYSTQDLPPYPEDYNQNFGSIGADLVTVFSELQNIGDVVLGNFNYMTSRLNRLQARVKSVVSYLTDYELLSGAPVKGLLYFTDSFNNLDRIESNSPLLNDTQCDVSQEEGIVTLPIDRTAQKVISITNLPVINSNSNGVPGNNQQSGAMLHGNIADILDDNADTWFEYERVISTEDGAPLILDLTINLGTPTVINVIRVNPVNFGTRTPLEILDIQTSADGSQGESIKPDLGIDSNATIPMAASVSKYAGQGFFTFQPRMSKYVHFVFRQDTSYPIKTNSGAVLTRYAIGIRDIDIQGLPFEASGELISTNFTSVQEISKVALQVDQVPAPAEPSSLGSISHYVSPDNGITWIQILPLGQVGTSGVESTVSNIVDFNSSNSSSVTTSAPVQSLRYKAIIQRNASAFSPNNSALATQILDGSEMFPLPLSAPFSFTLHQTPMPGSVRVLDPRWIGSTFGAGVPVAKGTGDQLILRLPFYEIPQRQYKTFIGSVWYLNSESNLSVKVGETNWNEGPLTGDATNYNLQPGNTRLGTPVQLEFGDNVNGAAPAPGASIALSFAKDELLTPDTSAEHISPLKYAVANDKSRVRITRHDSLTSITQTLGKGTKTFQLQPEATGFVFSDITVFSPTGQKSDVYSFAVPGDWTYDVSSGNLVSYSSTSTTVDTTVTYSYIPITVLSEDKWGFVDTSGVADSISISDSVYQTQSTTGEPTPGNVKYFNLINMAIVKGSLSFTNLTGDTPVALSKEMPFIDGSQELIGAVQTTEQLAAINAISYPLVASFSLRMPLTNDVALPVVFSQTNIFVSAKTSLAQVLAVGDYFVDNSTSPGTVHVKISAAVTSPGTVTYFYKDQTANKSGYYSVNYSTGEVCSHDPIETGVTSSYQFTNFLISYPAARLISSTDWIIDTQNSVVTLSDKEILFNLDIPSTSGTGNITETKYYEIAYRYAGQVRNNIENLEPFFSPILRQYSLEVVPRSSI